MNRLKKIGKLATVAAAGIVAAAGNASAVGLVDASAFTVDTASLGTIGGVALTALGLIWGFRKIVKTVNRS